MDSGMLGVEFLLAQMVLVGNGITRSGQVLSETGKCLWSEDDIDCCNLRMSDGHF